MNIEDLIRFGFKEWQINPTYDKHDRHWQYVVQDSVGKKLHVNIRLWAFSKYSTDKQPVEDSFDSHVQFNTRMYIENNQKCFNVDMSVNDMTPGEVVAWYENLWTKLCCNYYQKWEDN